MRIPRPAEPGSDEAIKAGCRCTRTQPAFRNIFHMSYSCKIHTRVFYVGGYKHRLFTHPAYHGFVEGHVLMLAGDRHDVVLERYQTEVTGDLGHVSNFGDDI